MKKNLFCAAAAVCVAVAFAACNQKAAENTEATETEAEPVEVVAEEAAAEVVDSLTNDTTVVVEEVVEAAPAE